MKTQKNTYTDTQDKQSAKNSTAGKIANKSKNNKKRRMAVVGAAAVAAIVLVAIVFTSISPAAASISAKCAYAAKGNIQEQVDSSGTIATGEEKTYFAPVSAEIERVYYRQGDVVAQGELLLEFDQDDIDYQYQTAKLNGTASQYTYLDAINQSSKGSSDKATLESEVAALKKSITAKESEIAAIESKINSAASSAQSETNSALQNIKSQQSTLSDEYLKLNKEAIDLSSDISGLQAEIASAEGKMEDTTQLRARLSEVNAQYSENQKRQLEINSQLSELSGLAESLGSSSDTLALDSQLTRANTDLAKLQSDLATKESELSLTKGSILTDEAAAQLRATNNSAELSTMTALELLDKAQEGIRADFDCIIVDVAVADGATSAQGYEMITVASIVDVKVNITVTKYDVESVKTGQSATVTALGNEYDGTLTRISRLATKNENGNNVFEAEITLTNPDDKIFLGADATVVLKGESVKDVIIVPSQAVNTSTDGDFCYVVEDGVVEKRMIETGLISNNHIEVTKGIRDGDVVITDITEDIVEGVSVAVDIEK